MAEAQQAAKKKKEARREILGPGLTAAQNVKAGVRVEPAGVKPRQTQKERLEELTKQMNDLIANAKEQVRPNVLEDVKSKTKQFQSFCDEFVQNGGNDVVVYKNRFNQEISDLLRKAQNAFIDEVQAIPRDSANAGLIDEKLRQYLAVQEKYKEVGGEEVEFTISIFNRGGGFNPGMAGAIRTWLKDVNLDPTVLSLDTQIFLFENPPRTITPLSEALEAHNKKMEAIVKAKNELKEAERAIRQVKNAGNAGEINLGVSRYNDALKNLEELLGDESEDVKSISQSVVRVERARLPNIVIGVAKNFDEKLLNAVKEFEEASGPGELSEKYLARLQTSMRALNAALELYGVEKFSEEYIKNPTLWIKLAQR